MRRRARGMMLIDVLAALVLLGGTVVTLLLAQSRAVQQLAWSRQHATASMLASELLTSWRLAETDVRAPDAGVFPDHPDWSWRRTAAQTIVAETVEAIEIRLDVVQREGDGVTKTRATYRWLELPDGESAL